jgi:esterase/lipase superfamily enzyme
MFISLFFAASMLMVSDRDQFWDSRTPSQQSQYAEVDGQGSAQILDEQQIEQAFEKMKGKRILLLVHGFDNAEPAPAYDQILSDIQNWDTASHYDQVIGYIWPCYDVFWSYYWAENNINIVTPRLRRLLYKMKTTAATVDVIAHSLGNRLFLQALNYDKKKEHSGIIDNFFAVAPAVNADSIDKKKVYSRAVQNCANMFVFFSARDGVLKWLYPIPEWNEALGYEGDVNPKMLPENIQMIDCSALIDSHVAYLYCKPVFTFVGQVEEDEFPGPRIAQDVVLEASGYFEVTRWREYKEGSLK